jgi:hypothetical protein
MVRVAGFRIQGSIILGIVQVKFGVRKIQRVKGEKFNIILQMKKVSQEEYV